MNFELNLLACVTSATSSRVVQRDVCTRPLDGHRLSVLLVSKGSDLTHDVGADDSTEKLPDNVGTNGKESNRPPFSDWSHLRRRNRVKGRSFDSG